MPVASLWCRSGRTKVHEGLKGHINNSHVNGRRGKERVETG